MKIFSALCILILTVSLMGCGDSKNQDHKVKSASSTEKAVATSEVTPDIQTDKPKSEVVAAPKKEETKKTDVRDEKTDTKEARVAKKKPTPKKVAIKKFAKIDFDSLTYDLPDITERETFERKFYFKNTSDIPLEIEKVTVTCGCTLPSYPFVPIAPDSMGYIGVFYNSVGKDGPQTPEVTVYANTKPGKTVLRMNFNVHPPKQEEKLDTLKAAKGE